MILRRFFQKKGPTLRGISSGHVFCAADFYMLCYMKFRWEKISNNHAKNAAAQELSSTGKEMKVYLYNDSTYRKKS